MGRMTEKADTLLHLAQQLHGDLCKVYRTKPKLMLGSAHIHQNTAMHIDPFSEHRHRLQLEWLALTVCI